MTRTLRAEVTAALQTPCTIPSPPPATYHHPDPHRYQQRRGNQQQRDMLLETFYYLESRTVAKWCLEC